MGGSLFYLASESGAMYRGFVYFCYALRKWWIGYAVRPIATFFLKKLAEHRYEDILVIDVLAFGRNKTIFLDITIQALALIARRDPRRFRRVRKEINYIMCSKPHGSRMIYSRPWRLCRVDIRQYPIASNTSNHTNDIVKRYAVDLIHEATHGYLFSKKMPYTKALQPRIERACAREAERFAQQL